MTTPLRAKYIRDLDIRGRAERTQESYSRYVSELAGYYHRSPKLISYQEVKILRSSLGGPAHSRDRSGKPGEPARPDYHSDLFACDRDEVSTRLTTARRARPQGHPS